MNLLKETLEDLKEYQIEERDVLWVGSSDGSLAISFEEFKKLADFGYDNGLGSQEIANDLVIVCCDKWLEREEYDGSEWWALRYMPKKNINAKVFSRLKGGMYSDLKTINNTGLSHE